MCATGPLGVLHSNTTPSDISQRAIFPYVWDSGTGSSASRAPASAPSRAGPRPFQLFLRHPVFFLRTRPTYKPAAERMAVAITRDVPLRPILKKVAENGAPGPNPWPDHSDMVPSHYSFPLPHDTCLHACHFWSLAYFFFPFCSSNLTNDSSRIPAYLTFKPIVSCEPFQRASQHGHHFRREMSQHCFCTCTQCSATDIWIRSDPHMKLQLSRMMCIFFRPARGVRRGAPARPRHRPLRSSVRFPLSFSFISRPSARSLCLKSGMSTVKKASRSVLRTIMVAHFGMCVAFICSLETFFHVVSHMTL